MDKKSSVSVEEVVLREEAFKIEENPFEFLQFYWFRYICPPVYELILQNRIFKDFQQSWIDGNYDIDSFYKFVVNNYISTTLLGICRLLDKGERNDDRNFRKFILSVEKNFNCIIESRKTDAPSITAKKLKIEHDENLKLLHKKKKMLERIRNKALCHQTSYNFKEEEKITQSEIDEIINLLAKLMLTYGKLFGENIAETRNLIHYANPFIVHNK